MTSFFFGPTPYKELKEALSKDCSIITLQTLLEKYITLSKYDFVDAYPAPPSNVCNFHLEEGIQSWFISCDQCLTVVDNYCICLKCFVESHESLPDHTFLIYPSEGGLCDCGAENVMSSKGFCPRHSIEGREERAQGVAPLAEKTGKSLRLFIRHILYYLKDLTCVQGYTEALFNSDQERSDSTNVIVEWLSTLATDASHIQRILCEEMMGLDISKMESAVGAVKNPQEWMTATSLLTPLAPISYNLFRFGGDKNKPFSLIQVMVSDYCYTLFPIYPLILQLACSNRVFRYLFMRIYAGAYFTCNLMRYKREPSGIVNIFSNCFVGDPFLLETVITQPQPNQTNNLLFELFKTNQEFVKRSIELYNNRVEGEYWALTDFIHAHKLFENLNIVKYVMDGKGKGNEIYEIVFDHALGLHSLDFEEIPDPRTIYSANYQERSLCKVIAEILKAEDVLIQKELVTPDQYSDRIYKSLISRIQRVIVEQNKLVSDRPHFALYRMLSTLLLYRPQYINRFVDNEQVPCETIIFTITMLYLRGISYTGTASMTDLFSDKQRMLDFFLMQLMMLKLTSKVFINTLFICRKFVLVASDDKSTKLFQFLMAILQCRAVLEGGDEEIKYHFSQLLALNFTVMDYQSKMKEFIFEKTPRSRILEILQKELYEQGIELKKLDRSNWSRIDPYYPYHVIGRVAERISSRGYSVVANAYPLPCVLPKLDMRLSRVMDVLEHPHLMDLARQMLVEKYTSSTALEGWVVGGARPLQYPTVVADCLYLVARLLGDYKEYIVSRWEPSYADQIHKEIGKSLLDEKSTPTNHGDVLFGIISKTRIADGRSFSILDILTERWKETKLTNQEMTPLTLHIFQLLIQIDSHFKEYFERINLVLETTEEETKRLDDQKKSVSDKRKMMMEKMRRQQQQFLSPEIKDEESEVKVVEEKEEELLCTLCNSPNTKSEPLFYLANFNDWSAVQLAQTQLDKQFAKNRAAWSTNYNEACEKQKNDAFYKMMTARNNSNYFTTCGHGIHRSCFISLLETKDEPVGFKCPLCNQATSTIAPLGHSNMMVHPTEPIKPDDLEEIFIDFIEDSFPLLRMIEQIRGFEFKSRSFEEYNGSLDEPYFCITQPQFDRELSWLRHIYRIIKTSCGLTSKKLELSLFERLVDHPMAMIDPFAFFVLRGLLNTKDDTEQTKSSRSDCANAHLENSMISYILDRLEEQGGDWQKFGTVEELYLLVTKHRLLPQPVTPDNYDDNMLNYLLPCMRQMALWDLVTSNNHLHIQPTQTLITLEQFSSPQHLLEHHPLFTTSTLHPLFATSTVLNKIASPSKYLIFPVPKYKKALEFTDFPVRYIDFIKRYVYPNPKYCKLCKCILNVICCMCGEMACCTLNCEGNLRGHMKSKECHSVPLGLFFKADSPLVYILTDITTVQEQLYRGPDFSANPTPNTNYIVQKERLKKLFIHYINILHSTEKFSPYNQA